MSVLVIEARDRIGGRIWTEYSKDKSFELGAGWIHGYKSNPLSYLSQKFKLKTRVYDYENSVAYNVSGQIVNDTTLEHIENLGNQFMAYLSDRQDNDENDISITQAYKDYIKDKGLSSRDAALLKYDLLYCARSQSEVFLM